MEVITYDSRSTIWLNSSKPHKISSSKYLDVKLKLMKCVCCKKPTTTDDS